MYTNQQQAINLMNNKAATSLALGHEREAIASLRDAFDLLAVACDTGINTNNNDGTLNDCCGGDDSASAQQEVAFRMDNKRVVYPLSNERKNSTAVTRSSNSFFVYNNCFVLGGREDNDADDHLVVTAWCESRLLAIKSAATIYNMALAYHRLALASSECKDLGAWTYKAITFYKQAIGLVVSDLRCRDSECKQQQRSDSIIIALAAYNNMGQICFDLLGDNEWAKGCFEALAHLIRYSPFVSESMQHDLQLCHDNEEDRLFFSKTDWVGLLSNLMFVDMMSTSVAAAA